MRRIIAVIIASVFILSAVFGLSACGGTKLPTTDYEKVQFAFNGVERSLKGSDTKKLSMDAGTDGDVRTLALIDDTPAVEFMAKTVGEDSLSTIYNAMSIEEQTDNPEFKYDEPPMIQFQYLKALYEEMGKNFAFGTKYAHTSTGTIYYDFKTRTAPEEEQYRNDYSFTCSVSLTIDSNDLITAFVGFDITFTNDGVSRHEKMYVEMVLDYDMNETSPTYELSMNAITDLLDYESADEKYFNDEYDYVRVEENSIREWRKFGICSPESLANYQGEDFVGKYSVLRAFKESKKYKTPNVFDTSTSLRNAVIDCLDLTDSIAAYQAFFARPAEETSKIKTVVDKFSRIYGKDIVNSLVYTGGSEKWVDDRPQDPENLYLRVIAKGDMSEPTIYQDYPLIELFNPSGNVVFDPKSGKPDYLSVYLKNGESNDVRIYNDFDELNVKVRSTAYDKTEWIEVNGHENESFASFVARSGFRMEYYSGEFESMTLQFDISLKSDPGVKLQDTFYIHLQSDEACRTILRKWETVAGFLNAYAPVPNAIPEFTGPSDTFFITHISNPADSDKSGDTLFDGRISFVSETNLSKYVEAYTEKLAGLGFVKADSQSTYLKRLDDETVLKLTVMSEGVDFKFVAQGQQTESLTDAIRGLIGNDSVEIPTFPGNYEYSVEGAQIRIQNRNGDYIGSYISSLEEYGFLIGSYNSYRAAYLYRDETLYRIRDMGFTIAVEKVSVVLNLTGDFNGWVPDDAESAFQDITFGSMGDICFERTVTVSDNQGIKVVKNRTWSDGGYGFGLFAGSMTFEPKKFQSGPEDAIIVLNGGTYTVQVCLGLDMFSANASENHVSLLMIDIK